MHRTQASAPQAEHSRQQWLQVCRARGTPAPDPAQVGRFLASLSAPAQAELDQALHLCLNGREKRQELATLSWAAACTRPALVEQVQAHGLACAGHHLFGAGLDLMASGWDMSARVAQLAGHPEDIAALRAALAQQAPAPPAESGSEVPPVHAHADPVRLVMPARPAQASVLADAPPEPPEWLAQAAWAPDDEGDADDAPPPWAGLHAVQAAPSRETRHAPGAQDPQPPAPAPVHERAQLRLFGRDAAHTLESGPHRRGSGFMGVHVVTVESARALGGGGYDWGRKLAVQLTPEEMPAAIAVLMNLSGSARFGQHGPARDKFIELRRQEGGLVVVTGQGGSVYAVPVKTATVYYLLNLFARAMAQGLPGGSVAEVLALVRAAH